MHTPYGAKRPSAPPLGELLSVSEAEGVRLDEWVRCKIRTKPSQSARSGCQLSQRESRGRFAPGPFPNRFLSSNEPGGLGNQRIGTPPVRHCQAALPPTLPPVWMNVLGTSPTMTVSATTIWLVMVKELVSPSTSTAASTLTSINS